VLLAWEIVARRSGLGYPCRAQSETGVSSFMRADVQQEAGDNIQLNLQIKRINNRRNPQSALLFPKKSPINFPY
jgi:hypothetical protein